MKNDVAIAAAGLVKAYRGRRVLDGVDLRVERGTIVALLGPNGAGKSTMVRILSTLVSPDAGTARVAGFDVVRDRGRVRRAISVTGQEVAVDDLQTGEENLRMVARLHGLGHSAAARRAAQLLELVDLTDSGGRRVGTYSGGMRRRLDIAAGLVGRPTVVFLDEPTTGLDPRSRQRTWRLVRGLIDEGTTVLLTTQYLEEADQLADRIVVLDAGRVVAEGTADELKQRYASVRLDVVASGPHAYAAIEQALGGRIVHSDPSRYLHGVATDGTAAHIRQLLDTIDPSRDAVAGFELHRATLDDVFLALTGHTATTDADGREPQTVRPDQSGQTKETVNV
jgi:ABC-2 type transport system ATP-binding protein